MISLRDRATERPRVLIVGTHLSKHGGHRTPSEELCDHLRRAGKVEVVSCSDRPHAATRLVHTVFTILRRWGRLDVAIIDVFSGRAFALAELSGFLARRCGAKTVFTLHGGGLPDLARRSPRRVDRLLRSADRVTSPSAFLAERFAGTGKITIIPNPIDLGRFRTVSEAALPSRPSGDAPHLVWLRAFHAIYRPWDAVEVLHRVVSVHETARLTLIGADKGDGSLQRVHETAERLGVTERVRVVLDLPHEDVPGALREADVFLNTTTIDNTPLSVLEALAAGVPVVTTDVGGIPHLVEHDRSALLSPVADPDSMAKYTIRLIEDPACAERLRREGATIAAAHDVCQVFPRWETLVQQLTESGS